MNPDLRPGAAGYGAELPATERAIPSLAPELSLSLAELGVRPTAADA